MKTKTLLIILAVALSNCLFGQNDHVLVQHGCNLIHQTEPGKYYYAQPSPEMAAIWDEIIDAAGDEGVYIRLVSSPNAANALATTSQGNRRLIIYNNTFVEKFKEESLTAWSAKFLLAHEVGHHYLEHLFSGKTREQNHQDELAADEFAARILARLGADANEVVAGISTWRDNFREDSETHPSPELRIEAASKAWQDEMRLKRSGARASVRRPILLDPTAFKNPWNVISEAKAFIDEEKVTVNFQLPATLSNNYRVCLLANGDDLSPGKNPGTISGSSPTNELANLGTGKSTVWNFQIDRYQREQVEVPEKLRFYVFDAENTPRPPSPGGAATSGILVTAGAALSVWGISQISSGQDLYNNTYLITRELTDYEAADAKYYRGQWILGGGLALSGAGIYALLKRGKRKNQYRRSHCGSSTSTALVPSFTADGIGLVYNFGR